MPLSKARKMATVHDQEHVMIAHEHSLALGLNESGRRVVGNLPMLGDPRQLAYTQLNDNGLPSMKCGFGMLLGGALTLFSDNPALTNWRFWLPDEPVPATKSAMVTK